MIVLFTLFFSILDQFSGRCRYTGSDAWKGCTTDSISHPAVQIEVRISSIDPPFVDILPACFCPSISIRIFCWLLYCLYCLRSLALSSVCPGQHHILHQVPLGLMCGCDVFRVGLSGEIRQGHECLYCDRSDIIVCLSLARDPGKLRDMSWYPALLFYVGTGVVFFLLALAIWSTCLFHVHLILITSWRTQEKIVRWPFIFICIHVAINGIISFVRCLFLRFPSLGSGWKLVVSSRLYLVVSVISEAGC